MLKIYETCFKVYFNDKWEFQFIKEIVIIYKEVPYLLTTVSTSAIIFAMQLLAQYLINIEWINKYIRMMHAFNKT